MEGFILNAKIERVSKDIEKTKGKISEFQTRLRELEKQKTELENMDIVDVVRGMNISITDLAALLKTSRATSGQNVQRSAATATATIETDDTDKEDTEE